MVRGLRPPTPQSPRPAPRSAGLDPTPNEIPMIDIVRTSLHRAITSPVGDRFLPVRLPKDLARRVNVILGEPLCSKTELARRRAGRAKLAELARNGGRPVTATGEDEKKPAQAPVVVYFEKDRNARVLGRIREALDAKAIEYTLLDVAGDEVTKDFVLREACVQEDELPVVFVASAPIGGYNELVDWDVSGRLTRALFPAARG